MLVSLLLILMKVQSSDADLKRNLRYLSETHFEFAIDLYHEVVKSRSGNLVISAHNVNVALAMLFLGTTANTTSSQQLRNFCLRSSKRLSVRSILNYQPFD